ncbi:MAG: ABC transporter ATP-binding protein [Deltaproteobacteria bacterium]|nr:ABC transporter ATP-binding protein [Deltaproteobacteria bacterium]MDH3384103.1 ABC transporter ATP-binding protein [Deltaproteobacteria bacterium]
MLRIKNLEAGYGPLKVLRKVSLHIDPGEIVTVIGANGAGKTTLLKTVSGLLASRGGEILFEKKAIRKVPAERIVSLGCSLVPEGRQLFAPMTVRENLILGACVQYRRRRHEEVTEDMERVFGLFPRLKEREAQLAGTLSGGEQQMLAIGRALLSRPRMLLLDEPSMGLAPRMVREIFTHIVHLRKEFGLTILLVEQNARGALAIADRGYVLETGRMVLQGPSEELLSNKNVQRAYLGWSSEESA